MLKQVDNNTIHVSLPQEYTHTVANTLKHIITDDIKSYAIERVTIVANDSIISDNMLCLRLGLIPIMLNPCDEYAPKEINFSLNVSYDPVRANDSIMYIFSNDLKISGIDDTSSIITQNIPIAVIKEHQRIELKAVATISTGYEHSKWSTVCAPSFWKENNVYVIKIETTGAKEPLTIFNESIDILKDQLLNVIHNDLRG